MGKRENPSNGRGNSCKLSKVIWGCSFSRFVAQKREKEPPCPTLTPKPTSSTPSRHPSGRRPRFYALRAVETLDPHLPPPNTTMKIWIAHLTVKSSDLGEGPKAGGGGNAPVCRGGLGAR